VSKNRSVSILMIFPGMVEDLPPLVTASLCLSTFGAAVTIVAVGCADNVRTILRSKGINLLLLDYDRYPSTKIGKILLRARFIRLLRKSYSENSDVIWYHGAHSMEYHYSVPSRKQCIIIVHAHELEEGRLKHIQNAVLRKADAFIVPEENRGWILKMFARTKAPFFVIYNRSSGDIIPETKNIGLVLEAFREHGGKKECRRFFIYQGLFSEDRCLKELIEGFRLLREDDIGLILLGSGVDKKYPNAIKEFAQPDRRIIIMPKMPSPNHLLFTRECSWGVLLYRPNSLNNIYCAPNKIYEYSFFGLGMLLPAFPGLVNLNQKYGIGEICDPENPLLIAQAMKFLIKREIAVFRDGTKRFLDDMKSPIDAYEPVYRFILEGSRGSTNQKNLR
jgi:glycosyltransferase involved in cell wall biosynthesis